MKRSSPAPANPCQATAPHRDTHRREKSKSKDNDVILNEQLQARLQRLSFIAFEGLVQQALVCSGFNRVHAPGRSYRRGRLTHGGLDISAYSSTDLTNSLTLVQIKQYREGVPRRFVDELRGVMLRLGARHGLLIATSHFSPAAYAAAGADDTTGANGTAGADSLAPIRLLAGHELSALLIQHGLAVRQQADGRKVLDKRFLRKLEANAAQPRRPRSAAVPRDLADPAFSSTSPNRNPVAPPAASESADQKGSPMTWSTHVLFGISSLWLLQPLNQAPSLAPALDPANFALLVGAAAFGALLPDLDAAESKLKYLKIGGLKPFFLPAQLVHRQLGHRGLAHSDG